MSGRFVLKLTAWAIALTLVALPVVGVLNGWFAVERWPVRYVEIEAEYSHVSAEQIRAAAAAHLGAGFFALNLAEVRGAVAALPWVEAVEARKRWPDTLVLAVRERQPVARWGDKRLVGRDGNVFSVPGAEQIEGLPHLDGPDSELGNVLDFYARMQKALSGSGLTPAGVSLSGRGSWKITLVGGAEILLGHDQVETRIQRFLDVLPRLSSDHPGGFQRADLRYSNGFAVQWSAPPPAPPATAKPAGASAAVLPARTARTRTA